MNFQSIKNIFNKKAPKTKLVKGINPERDWQFILKIYSFVIIILITLSLYFLYKIKNEDFFHINNDTEASPISINQQMLDTILTSFDTKSKIVNDLKLGDKIFVDPSK